MRFVILPRYFSFLQNQNQRVARYMYVYIHAENKAIKLSVGTRTVFKTALNLSQHAFFCVPETVCV